jgi:acyl-coenzyme A thioesterase PaaI-like protein
MLKFLLKNKLGVLLRTTWCCLAFLPFGKRLFSKWVGRRAPFTASIKPYVRTLRAGYAKVEMAARADLRLGAYAEKIHATLVPTEPGFTKVLMPDLPGLRNPFNSLHAVAQAALGILTTRQACLPLLPPGTTPFLADLTLEYFIKARGPLQAESGSGSYRTTCESEGTTPEFYVPAHILNGNREVVSFVRSHWRAAPLAEDLSDTIDPAAILNLGEAVTGLAFLYGLPDGWQSILVGLDITFVKPARGTLTGTCACAPCPTSTGDVTVAAWVKDSKGDVVARVLATWKVSPVSSY